MLGSFDLLLVYNFMIMKELYDELDILKIL